MVGDFGGYVVVVFVLFCFFFGGGGGVTSNFDNFYGLLFFKINNSNLCSLQKCIITHATIAIKDNGQRNFTMMF